MTSSLHTWPAWRAAEALARRDINSADLVRACLDRVSERELEVQAFAHLAADAALAQAKALDAGPLRGPLHGLPLGVKDLLDTGDMPTAYGSSIYAGHQPRADAAAVAHCRDSGAVVLGKTVTTELANMSPGVTRNPHRLDHTPGGSSSGSAAAVADCMLPLALGTQTAGSLIRPAAYCGVVGYKPSHQTVSRAGIKSLSDSLDTVGGFGRTVRDVALLGSVLTANASLNDAALWRAFEGAAPRLAWCQTPDWALAEEATQSAWAQAQHLLKDLGTLLTLPEGLTGLVPLQKAIQAFETAQSLRPEQRLAEHQLSQPLRDLLADGSRISGEQHGLNLRQVADCRRQAAGLFNDLDVLIAPSTLGEAPHGLQTTGDPLFCRGWTVLGLPCIHLPFAKGPHGLPVGLQVVGAYGQDARLLAAAHWLHQRLLAES